jgi:2-keto-3-deoxy-L-rhamnonate aldolase RhmA
MRNELRPAMRRGAVTIGSWLQFGHTGVAEVMAQAGFDWIGIDMEHSTIGIEAVQPLIQVIELSGCVPLVRLSSNDAVLAKRVMDAGAHGTIVPSVNSADEAEQAVRSVRYPPAGMRGMGLGRAHGYGGRFAPYLAEVELFSVVVVMLEHRTGVERVEEIARVPGVDGLFIGPYDLSASYDVPGQLDHPLVKDAMTRIVLAAQEAGIAAGIHVVHPPAKQIVARIEEGFRFIAYGGDMLFLVPAARDAVAQVRDLADWRPSERRP